MMRALLPLVPAAVLLMSSACLVGSPGHPSIDRAEAGCLPDDNGGPDFWLLDAWVSHTDGLDIEDVWVEVRDPDDSFTLGNVALIPDLDEPGYWAEVVNSTEDFLDCDSTFGYWFTFTAEDENGNTEAHRLNN
jgi:hypothetical protein